MTEEEIWIAGHPRQTKGPAFLYVVAVHDSNHAATLFGTFTSLEVAEGFIESATDEAWPEPHLTEDEASRAVVLTINNVWR